MLKRKSVQTLLLSAVAIMVICLLAAAISLTTQKPINKADSKPAGLAGVQVTVVSKSPTNAHEAAHTVQQGRESQAKPQSVFTNADGAFDLGVLPAGTYALTLIMSESAKNAARNKDVYIKQDIKRQGTGVMLATVTIEGAADGTVVKTWDFASNKAVEAPAMTVKGTLNPGSEAARKTPQPDITFTADGKQKVKGKVHDASMAAIQNTR